VKSKCLFLCRPTENYVSARALFQAVRSHLHFSQLSAWLNATHGMAPQCIGYRLVAHELLRHTHTSYGTEHVDYLFFDHCLRYDEWMCGIEQDDD
jgi:hypothetical protein